MKRSCVPLLTAALVLAAWPAPAAAARLEGGPGFTLPVEETQAGDLYFGGNTLRLDGLVDGSVLAGCQTATISGPVSGNVFIGAQTVDISGPVDGDVLVGAQTVTISNTVSGAVRAGAGSVHIHGYIERDILAGCGNLAIGREAEVGGDIIAGCGTLVIDGMVHGDVRCSAGELIICGIVDGDVIADIEDQLVLADDARIFGSLRYQSEKELDLGNPDAVFGDIQYTKSTKAGDIEELKCFRPRPDLLATFLLPFAILSLLGALAIGFILIAIWKHALNSVLEDVLARFGRTVGLGALSLFATPVAIIIALLLIITIPAGLIGGLLFLVCLYLSKILAGMFLGKWLFRLFGGHTASIWLYAPVGIILVYALCAIPFFGSLVWLFAAIIGFGTILELLNLSRRT